jgi:hypothetical protein
MHLRGAEPVLLRCCDEPKTVDSAPPEGRDIPLANETISRAVEIAGVHDLVVVHHDLDRSDCRLAVISHSSPLLTTRAYPVWSTGEMAAA